MADFAYKGGKLMAEGVPLARLAAEFGTPFYCYSTAALERQYRGFAAAFADVDAMVCYALKANSTLAVVCTLPKAGAGAEVVWVGPLRVAHAAGIPPERIIFSGG
ncbi:MAG: diaminopimelate decarboxylase, partial [Alphaproteobacteria bacterium]